jgi:ferritin-like metal-binding protein YciE
VAPLVTLHQLLLDELKDIYSAEKQLVKAIPKMTKAVSSPHLKRAFQQHLVTTEAQVERLDQIFQRLGDSPRGKKCRGMAGLLEEGDEACRQDGDNDVVDAGIIGAAQRVEHYEIAAYGTARAHAETLGHEEIARVLQQSLAEEEEADRALTEIATGTINPLAMVTVEGGDQRPRPLDRAPRRPYR